VRTPRRAQRRDQQAAPQEAASGRP